MISSRINNSDCDTLLGTSYFHTLVELQPHACLQALAVYEERVLQ